MAPRKPKQARLWGYLDGHGLEVIRPRFEDVQPFSGGGAWVRAEGRWGRIDREGAWLLAPTFVELREHRQGLRKVITDERRVMWVDEHSGERRCDGLRVGQGDDWTEDPHGRYWANLGGTTDPDTHACSGGTWQLRGADHRAIGPALDSGRGPWWLGEDRFIASDARGVWRVCGLDGRARGPERTGACFGIEATRMRTAANGFWGAYDLDGVVAFAPARFRTLTRFDERGFAVAWLGEDRVAVVDLDGGVRAEAEVPFAGAVAHCEGFVHGYARVSPGPGRSQVNLLDADGRWILDAWAYDASTPEADQHFALRSTTDWNVRDTGSNADLFERGQSRVEFIDGWGWAGYSTDGRVGIRDSLGEWRIAPLECDALARVDDELVRVTIGGLAGAARHGLHRRDGTWALEPVWDEIHVAGDVLLGARGGSLGHPWGRRDGRVRRKDATWSLLTRDGSEIATLAKLPWAPGRLAEDRMAFTPATRRKPKK